MPFGTVQRACCPDAAPACSWTTTGLPLASSSSKATFCSLPPLPLVTVPNSSGVGLATQRRPIVLRPGTACRLVGACRPGVRVTTRVGGFLPSAELNFFQPYGSFSSVARSPRPAVSGPLLAHCAIRGVTLTVVQPPGQRASPPLVSVDEVIFLVHLGWDVHRVAWVGVPVSHTSHGRFSQVHEWWLCSRSSASTMCLPRSCLVGKARKERATCWEPLLPSFNSGAPD